MVPSTSLQYPQKLTPNRDHFSNTKSASISLQLQVIDIDTWVLRIEGLVNRPLNLTYDQLRALPAKTVYAELYCEGLVFVTDGNWTGVELKYLLSLVDVKPEADDAVIIGVDGYYYSLPVYWIRMVPDILLAYEKNGAPLSHIDGFPAAIAAPGLEGYYWVKWVYNIVFVANIEDSTTIETKMTSEMDTVSKTEIVTGMEMISEMDIVSETVVEFSSKQLTIILSCLLFIFSNTFLTSKKRQKKF